MIRIVKQDFSNYVKELAYHFCYDKCMSTIKTQFGKEAAELFLEEHLHAPVSELKMIGGGELSQAFLFDTPEGARVLRVSNQSKDDFLKDQVAMRFNSEVLPVPEVFEVGGIEDGLYFAISERAEGKPLDEFSGEEVQELMPEIIAMVDAIHALEPIGEGYGQWGLDGKGRSKTWKDELRDHSMSEDDEETCGADFYDSDLHMRLREEIRPLIELMPEERVMIHDDVGFGNALSDGKKITAVIDWVQAGYGDPLRDVAWLDFWDEKQGFADAFKKHYEEQGKPSKDFEQRLLCYKLLIGLNSLGFFARSRQKEKYDYAIGIIDRIRK